AGTIRGEGIGDDAQFGAAITVAGNRVAVGAPGHEGHGAVLVFSRAADGTFSQETASPLAARRLSDNARFGTTLVFDGDKLLVGAPGAIFVPQVERAAAEQGAQQGGGRRAGFGAGVG